MRTVLAHRSDRGCAPTEVFPPISHPPLRDLMRSRKCCEELNHQEKRELGFQKMKKRRKKKGEVICGLAKMAGKGSSSGDSYYYNRKGFGW